MNNILKVKISSHCKESLLYGILLKEKWFIKNKKKNLKDLKSITNTNKS